VIYCELEERKGATIDHKCNSSMFSTRRIYTKKEFTNSAALFIGSIFLDDMRSFCYIIHHRKERGIKRSGCTNHPLKEFTGQEHRQVRISTDKRNLARERKRGEERNSVSTGFAPALPPDKQKLCSCSRDREKLCKLVSMKEIEDISCKEHIENSCSSGGTRQEARGLLTS
jgi:hypothetical protein